MMVEDRKKNYAYKKNNQKIINQKTNKLLIIHTNLIKQFQNYKQLFVKVLEKKRGTKKKTVMSNKKKKE